jgi:hypothetical protein
MSIEPITTQTDRVKALARLSKAAHLLLGHAPSAVTLGIIQDRMLPSPSRQDVLDAATVISLALKCDREQALNIIAPYYQQRDWNTLSAALGGKQKKQSINKTLSPTPSLPYTLSGNVVQRKLLLQALQAVHRTCALDLNWIVSSYKAKPETSPLSLRAYCKSEEDISQRIDDEMSIVKEGFTLYARSMDNQHHLQTLNRDVMILHNQLAQQGDTWSLDLDKQDIDVLIKATDILSRCMMGQFRIVGELLSDYMQNTHSSDYSKLHDACEALQHVESLVTGLPRASYHGIRSPQLNDSARILYDIQQVLRYQMALEEGDKSRHSVWRYEPSKTSTSSEMAVLTGHTSLQEEKHETSPKL